MPRKKAVNKGKDTRRRHTPAFKCHSGRRKIYNDPRYQIPFHRCKEDEFFMA